VVYLETIILQLPRDPAVAVTVKIKTDGLYPIQDIHISLQHAESDSCG